MEFWEAFILAFQVFFACLAGRMLVFVSGGAPFLPLEEFTIVNYLTFAWTRSVRNKGSARCSHRSSKKKLSRLSYLTNNNSSSSSRGNWVFKFNLMQSNRICKNIKPASMILRLGCYSLSKLLTKLTEGPRRKRQCSGTFGRGTLPPAFGRFGCCCGRGRE